jgi:hypothetical protein
MLLCWQCSTQKSCAVLAAASSASPVRLRWHAGTCLRLAWPAGAERKCRSAGADKEQTQVVCAYMQCAASAHGLSDTSWSTKLLRAPSPRGWPAALRPYLRHAAALHHGPSKGALDGVQVLLAGAACRNITRTRNTTPAPHEQRPMRNITRTRNTTPAPHEHQA